MRELSFAGTFSESELGVPKRGKVFNSYYYRGCKATSIPPGICVTPRARGAGASAENLNKFLAKKRNPTTRATNSSACPDELAGASRQKQMLLKAVALWKVDRYIAALLPRTPLYNIETRK
jgi:hypothetical protein